MTMTQGDERLFAAFWRWFFLEPVSEDEDAREAAMGDLRRLLEVLDEEGYEIVRREGEGRGSTEERNTGGRDAGKAK